jgi:SAM-dependent methyltransferase
VADAYEPHGRALVDCFRGNAAAMLICHQDGERDDVPASFWLRDQIDPLEALSLELCRGRVLDVGAGAGVHALALQQRGLHVTAIDISPACVEIMRERGVRDALAIDMFALEGRRFDTVLCLCNGLDKVGTLDALPGFLGHVRSLLAPDGQLIADSFDLRVGADAAAHDALARKSAAGRYFGELDLRFEYEGRSGPPFSVLQVDPDTLARAAAQAGLTCELVSVQGGHYLARARPV